MTLLIIGIGNPLRGDDGAGPIAAQRIYAYAQAHALLARLLILHQLGPEIAEELAYPGVGAVIFVDAAISEPLPQNTHEIQESAPRAMRCGVNGLQLTRLACGAPERPGPQASHTGLTHHVAPMAVVTCAALLYAATPPCWTLNIPATEFGFGADLSVATAAALADVVHCAALIVDAVVSESVPCAQSATQLC